MRVPIYYQNGEVFRTVAIDEESSIEISIREIGSITLVFSLPESISFPVNAFILHDGIKYIISSGIKCEMSNTRQYDYSVQFYDEASLLRRIVVRNPESGSVNFQYTAGIEEHLSIIVSNLNRNDDNKWSVGECVESAGVKYLQYSYVSCMDALDSLANLFDTEWEIDGRTIHLHKIQHNVDTPVELSYGKGNGLRPGITSEMVQAPLTRLFTQGSSRNIDMLIYGSPILLLPKSVTMRYDGEKFEGEDGFDINKSRAYTTNFDGTFISSVTNINEPSNEGVLNCEDIYPVIEHKVLSFSHNSDSGSPLIVPSRYSVIIMDIPETLDYTEYSIQGQVPSITFQSGLLAGKTFPILLNKEGKPNIKKIYKNGVFYGWEFKINYIYIGGVIYPDYEKDITPAIGDVCRMFGFSLPPESINDDANRTGASWNMLKRGISYLFDRELAVYSISADIDPIWLHNHQSELSNFILGGYIKYIHPSWAPDGIMMRIQRIKRSLVSVFNIGIELSNGIVGGGIIKNLSDSIAMQSGQLYEQSQSQNATDYNSSIGEGDVVTLSTAQTITGKKTFAEDVVFGADGSKLFIPSGTPGTYDIFVDPGMAVEGEEPSGGGSGEWETWEDASGADVPVGFHRVTSTFPTSFIKGHIYFFTDTGQLALATGTSSASLSYYSSLVRNVSYSTVSKTLTITPAGEYSRPVTINLSSFAEKAQLGDLSDLTTESKSDLVSAINEVLAAVDAGGTGSVVTITESTPSGYAKSYTVKQGSKTVGVINIPKDMVVSSGEVETNPSGKPSGTYLVLTLANATSDKVYINVGTLVDIYTAAKNAAQVQLSINSATREISATIVAGSITATELASKCVTGAKIADGAVNTSHISNGAVSILKLESSLQKILNNALSASDITTGKTNGSIAVEGNDVPVKGLGSAAYKDEGYFVTVSTNQTITGKKTFAEDVVFGADGSKLFIPSGTPGTYDIFVDPGMAVEGEEPSGGGSGEWETWEDASGADVPVGFHLLTSMAGQTFIKGHIYFNEDTGILYVAESSGSNVTSLKPFAGRVDSVSYNSSTKTLTVKTTSGSSNTINLSDLSGQPLWCGRVSSSGVDTRVSGTLTITVNRSNEGVYGIKGAPVGRTVIVSPLDYFVGSASLVKAPHIAVVSQSSTGILTVRMYTLDGTLDDFGFSLMII